MPKYRFMPVVYASCCPIEIEAKNENEALKKAEKLYEYTQLCWSCSDKVELGDQPIWDKQYLELIE